ncbi:hypothetical protein [Streptomyces dysideae]|uniref:hypothetical protein n=1 Tax=Streptomyces dysideae TaxID=909626 RepID=UPI000B22ABFF|nr:hypothetical protein [Streptomyces dysideae]
MTARLDFGRGITVASGQGDRERYVVTSEDVGDGQYLSDGTGVFRFWRLNWI